MKAGDKEFNLICSAMMLLELPPRPEHDISEHDLKRAAHEILSAIYLRTVGFPVPPRSEKSKQIAALMQAEIAIGNASIKLKD